ncbi:hypothetical protein ACF1DW_04335 [Streptomyces sp. NPDC014603]|uniref:hypothetical protein n=1 Tax=Streptomyces sp. NPDC014603 TaxID=3364873 RepID=UPI0036F8C052
MRTRTALTAALLALAALTSCSSEDQADTKPSTKPSPSAPSAETQYLTAAQEITFNGDPTDAELQAFPPQWCEALNDGHSVQWIFGIRDGGLYPVGETWGTVKADAYKLLIAGVRAYCPDHLSAVQDELRATGEY